MWPFRLRACPQISCAKLCRILVRIQGALKGRRILGLYATFDVTHKTDQNTSKVICGQAISIQNSYRRFICPFFCNTKLLRRFSGNSSPSILPLTLIVACYPQADFFPKSSAAILRILPLIPGCDQVIGGNVCPVGT